MSSSILERNGPPRVSVRRVGRITAEETQSAAQILSDGFWGCNSSKGQECAHEPTAPILRFRAHNDRKALTELMTSRVVAASQSGALFLGYKAQEGQSVQEAEGKVRHDVDVDVDGGVKGDQSSLSGVGEMIGAVIVSLPGEGFTQLQKNYGDKKTEPAVKETKEVGAVKSESETEAERKTRVWVEEDLVPWFNDFSNRSLGSGVLENSLYISLFAMKSEYQSKGLGRELMNQLISWGDEQKWEMTLFDHEPELVRFYSSFGFKEVGREMRLCDGKEVTWWAMRRTKESG